MSGPVEQQNTDGEVDLQSMDDEFEILNIDTDVEKNLLNMENDNQDCQEQSTSGVNSKSPNQSNEPSSPKKVVNLNPETASTGNDSLPPHSEIPQSISRSQSDPLPYQFQPLRSTSMEGVPSAPVPHPEDVSESALELNPNEIMTEDNPAQRRGYAFIKINEYKKLKTEANEAERMKLKHNTLMEQHNNLLEQHNALLELQKYKPKISDSEYEQLKQKAEKNASIIEQLKSKVECPVCYEIPKRIPIPVCPNGHVVCQSCNRDEDCPMCREGMEGGKSLIAATIVQNLLHDCDNVIYGCEVFQMKHSDLVKHLDTCPYRFHYNGWTNLSMVAGGIKLKGNFVDLGIKVSPVTSFYDSIGSQYTDRRKVMWPPNAIEYDGTTFFLYVTSDEYRNGIWQFIVRRGDDRLPGVPSGEHKVMIVVFKPGDHSGCTRHFHQHSILGRLDANDQLIFTLNSGHMQGLLLDGKFAVTVNILRDEEDFSGDTPEDVMGYHDVNYDIIDNAFYCCDVMRGGSLSHKKT